MGHPLLENFIGVYSQNLTFTHHPIVGIILAIVFPIIQLLLLFIQLSKSFQQLFFPIIQLLLPIIQSSESFQQLFFHHPIIFYHQSVIKLKALKHETFSDDNIGHYPGIGSLNGRIGVPCPLIKIFAGYFIEGIR